MKKPKRKRTGRSWVFGKVSDSGIDLNVIYEKDSVLAKIHALIAEKEKRRTRQKEVIKDKRKRIRLHEKEIEALETRIRQRKKWISEVKTSLVSAEKKRNAITKSIFGTRRRISLRKLKIQGDVRKALSKEAYIAAGLTIPQHLKRIKTLKNIIKDEKVSG